MNVILKFDPQNKNALDSISRARAQMTVRQVEDLLGQAKTALENKNHARVMELSQKILSLDPDNEAAKNYTAQSALQLAPQEIKGIIGEYVRSVKENILVQFYAAHCTPDFYKTIKAQTETIVKSSSFNDE